MRKLGYHHGSAALGLALMAQARNNPIIEQATASRHRGREFSLKAPTLGKSERA